MSIREALDFFDWITARQEDLLEFERNKVWTLDPPHSDHPVVGKRWVFQNKLGSVG